MKYSQQELDNILHYRYINLNSKMIKKLFSKISFKKISRYITFSVAMNENIFTRLRKYVTSTLYFLLQIDFCWF